MVAKRSYKLVCESCRSYFDSDDVQECENCGELVSVDFDVASVECSKQNLDRRGKMWQFSDMLPLKPDDVPVTLGEGDSPLLWKAEMQQSDRKKIPCRVGFKVDYVNPTCSFKDRGASLLLTKARASKKNSVVIDSSGNAAASVSAYAAKARMLCYVFVPDKTSADKLKQIAAYGSSLTRIVGTREDVLGAARKYAIQSNSYYCGFQFNPFASEATKTVAYEIAQQTNWEAPDYVISPMGTGGLAIGLAKGFLDLAALNWISASPKLIGVQAEGCSPIVISFKKKSKKVVPVDDPHSVAEGLKIGYPHKSEQVVKLISRTGGDALTVTDSEILEAMDYLAREEGLYVEPSGAVSFAGFLKLSDNNFFSHDQRVVCILTGSGLKSSSGSLTPS